MFEHQFTAKNGEEGMENRKQLWPKDKSEPELSYFGLQAYIGTTKHLGGFESTKELIQLCHIGEAEHVLDIGCGVGATACYLAKRYGCSVVGVDVRESMVTRSRARSSKEGVEDRIQFHVADAQDLPFEDALFDAVICESVATFIQDKQRVADEYARVTKPGGYVGLNEEIWIKTPPPAELVEFAKHTWDIESNISTSDVWLGLLEGAGLRDIAVKTYEFNARRESSQIRRYGLEDMARMLSKSLSLYIKSPSFREYMRERRRLPKRLFEFLGYGLFVGRR
jgi:SAM-dependent methyltransferase